MVASHFKVKYHHLKPKPEAPKALPQHVGDIVMGTKITSSVTGSNVGAFAVGNHAHAEGTISMNRSITQAGHVAHIKAAQRAIVNDQDALDRIDSRLYEALGQFLRFARDIQVEQKSMVETQAKMKDTLDEVGEQHRPRPTWIQGAG